MPKALGWAPHARIQKIRVLLTLFLKNAYAHGPFYSSHQVHRLLANWAVLRLKTARTSASAEAGKQAAGSRVCDTRIRHMQARGRDPARVPTSTKVALVHPTAATCELTCEGLVVLSHWAQHSCQISRHGPAFNAKEQAAGACQGSGSRGSAGVASGQSSRAVTCSRASCRVPGMGSRSADALQKRHGAFAHFAATAGCPASAAALFLTPGNVGVIGPALERLPLPEVGHCARGLDNCTQASRHAGREASPGSVRTGKLP